MAVGCQEHHFFFVPLHLAGFAWCASIKYNYLVGFMYSLSIFLYFLAVLGTVAIQDYGCVRICNILDFACLSKCGISKNLIWI
jgi:hypothetical protein